MPKQKGLSEKKNARAGSEPKASRPILPEGYISKSKKGMLPWSWVDERMSKSFNYWVATTRPDGRPHVMPVWGVWMNRIFYFGTDPQTRKARNLKLNPQMVVHLESGDEAVILEGRMEEIRESSLLKQIDEAFFAKYEMHTGHGSEDAPMYALRPSKAFAWQVMNINESATRFSFDD